MEIEGKKIIFVYPPELVKQHLLAFLAEKEYEVYALWDEQKVKQIAGTYSDTIFFFNLNSDSTESQFEKYLESIKHDITNLQFGLLSFNFVSPDVIQHYIMDYGVNCGVIQLKLGTKVAENMMLKILTANEAKGRRKYIRYTCRDSDQISLNLKIGNDIVQGSVYDISSVGMSCQFDKPQFSFVKNQMIPDIQLRLRGPLAHVGGVVWGIRKMADGTDRYVIIFKENKEDKSKQTIRKFISDSLQKQFEEQFKLS